MLAIFFKRTCWAKRALSVLSEVTLVIVWVAQPLLSELTLGILGLSNPYFGDGLATFGFDVSCQLSNPRPFI